MCCNVVHRVLCSTLDPFTIFHLFLARPPEARLSTVSIWLCFLPSPASQRKGRCGLLRLCHGDARGLISVTGRIQVICAQDGCLSEWEEICGSLEEPGSPNLPPPPPCLTRMRNAETDMCNHPDLIAGSLAQERNTIRNLCSLLLKQMFPRVCTGAPLGNCTF